MNQILQTQPVNQHKSSGPIEIHKIVKFFVVAIILFAVAIISLTSYAMVSNKEEKTTNKTNTPAVAEQNEKPEVDITSQDKILTINITHTKPLSKVTYKWNEENENEIETNNQTTLTQEIPLPFGVNTLYVTVTDEVGQETKFKKEYTLEPIIDLAITPENKIKITVEDSSNLNYISYAWNNDEEQQEVANPEDATRIEKEIDIPLGQNTLKVQAVNANNEVATKELEVKGIKKPVLTVTKDGDNIILKAEDEREIKIIYYTLNGQKYQINGNNRKVIEYKQQIPKGESDLEISVENIDGGIVERKIKCVNN